MSLHRLVACALLGAPLLTFAQATPEGAPAAPAAATETAAAPAPAPAAAAPAPAPAVGPALQAPFTQRGHAIADAVFRGGPDALAEARATVVAGTALAVAPGVVRGFVRVRVASGESGYVLAHAVALDEGAAATEPVTPAASPGAVAQVAPPVTRPLAPPPAPVSAEPRKGGAFAHLGVAIPADSYLDGFGNGLALEAGFALPLQRDMAFEISVGYSKHTASEYGVDMSFKSVPVLAGIRFIAPSPSAELYAIVGAGLDFVTLEGSGYGVTVSDSATAPVLQLGGGLAFAMGGGARFDLQLRYWAGTAEMMDVEGGIDVTSISAGVSF